MDQGNFKPKDRLILCTHHFRFQGHAGWKAYPAKPVITPDSSEWPEAPTWTRTRKDEYGMYNATFDMLDSIKISTPATWAQHHANKVKPNYPPMPVGSTEDGWKSINSGS